MLTPEQIKKFEDAIKGPGPAGDPNWQITQGLLKLTVVQAREIIKLQDRLAARSDSAQAASAALLQGIESGMGVKVAQSGLSQQEITGAINSLNDAVKAHRSGQQVAQYAGSLLKFAALFI